MSTEYVFPSIYIPQPGILSLSRRRRRDQLGDAAGHHRDVQRELSERPRLFVRPPG